MTERKLVLTVVGEAHAPGWGAEPGGAFDKEKAARHCPSEWMHSF